MTVETVRKDLRAVYDRLTLYAEVYSMKDLAEMVQGWEKSLADVDYVSPEEAESLEADKDDEAARADEAEMECDRLEGRIADLESEISLLKEAI